MAEVPAGAVGLQSSWLNSTLRSSRSFSSTDARSMSCSLSSCISTAHHQHEWLQTVLLADSYMKAHVLSVAAMQPGNQEQGSTFLMLSCLTCTAPPVSCGGCSKALSKGFEQPDTFTLRTLRRGCGKAVDMSAGAPTKGGQAPAAGRGVTDSILIMMLDLPKVPKNPSTAPPPSLPD